MAETYEEEGIIYFEEPYKTDLWAWLDTHIGLDTLFVRNRQALDIVTAFHSEEYEQQCGYHADSIDVFQVMS